jgi:hypothetical protein
MQIPQALALTPRCAEPTLPGTWKLAPGRAITLEPRESGLLKVAHGRLWVTFEGPHAGAANDSGDHIMGTGDHVRIEPGQRLVVEAWNERCPAYFSWDPSPVPVAPRTSWDEAVKPLSDLRLAFVYGSHAAGRLVAGVAQIMWQSLFRPRIAAQEDTCCANGAMG